VNVNNNPYNNNYNNNNNDNLLAGNAQKDFESVSDMNKEVTAMMRLGFIRKVYGVLFCQLFFTALISSIGFMQPVQSYYSKTMWPFWTAFALALVILIPLACFKKVARTVPMNYILLFSFTACESIMLSYMFAAVNNWKIVVTAAAITVAVVGALTLYACTTKTDFTFLGGILFVSATLLMFLGFFSIMFGYFLNTLYCILGVFVFSIYLIFDTQLVMGNCGLEYSVDDYVIAALNIYLDIIQIFLYILSLLANRN